MMRWVGQQQELADLLLLVAAECVSAADAEVLPLQPAKQKSKLHTCCQTMGGG